MFVLIFLLVFEELQKLDLFQLSIVDMLKVNEYAQDSGGSRGGSGG